MSNGTLYLEENLQLDYNHLESVDCFCGGPKEIGDVLCPRCLALLPPMDRTKLFGMKPGEGLASEVAHLHGMMLRARKGWLG
jgi:hypothetical protein